MHRALLLALLVAAFAGCADGPGSESTDLDSDINNAPGQGSTGDVTGGPTCIHTTTGDETRGPGDNPCPQGQYPAGD